MTRVRSVVPNLILQLCRNPSCREPHAQLTRRPPSLAAHGHGPGRFPSSWAVAPAPSKPPISPPKAALRLRICAPTRLQVPAPRRVHLRAARQAAHLALQAAALCVRAGNPVGEGRWAGLGWPGGLRREGGLSPKPAAPAPEGRQPQPKGVGPKGACLPLGCLPLDRRPQPKGRP